MRERTPFIKAKAEILIAEYRHAQDRYSIILSEEYAEDDEKHIAHLNYHAAQVEFTGMAMMNFMIKVKMLCNPELEEYQTELQFETRMQEDQEATFESVVIELQELTGAFGGGIGHD